MTERLEARRARRARRARQSRAGTAARLLGTLAIPIAPWVFQSLAGSPVPPSSTGTLEPSAFAGTSAPYTVSFAAPVTGTLALPASTAPAPTPPDAASAPTGADRDSCPAALAYLAAHAAPGFQVTCPHGAGGHQASTVCIRLATCVPGTGQIWIADPCPAAYMNEASNSWVLMGESDAPWDPYGYCGQPRNPLG